MNVQKEEKIKDSLERLMRGEEGEIVKKMSTIFKKLIIVCYE